MVGANELHTFLHIWSTAILTLIFCHQIVARIPAGAARLLSLLPVFYLFTTLPLRLTSVHLCGPTVLYLVWLANSKLILFAFDQPPLSASPPLSLLHFIIIAIFPIRRSTLTPKSNPSRGSPLQFFVKCLLLALVVKSYGYRESIHPYLILALYCLHVYLGVELVLAITAAPVRAVLGLDLEPQFNEPYLASSLQDFWGRRWNLVVSGILRPTVYLPVLGLSTRVIGRRWAHAPAMLASFVVSGLMHEVVYYYLTRAPPTWEVTWFFVLHGFCVVAEVNLKRAVAGKFRLPWSVSCPLTVVFVVVTARWLFFPQLIRSGLDLKAIDEYQILGELWEL